MSAEVSFSKIGLNADSPAMKEVAVSDATVVGTMFLAQKWRNVSRNNAAV